MENPTDGNVRPDRGSFLIRNCRIVSMDDAIGDLDSGDLLIRDGLIADVGTELDAPDAEVIDATHLIAIPGLIDTHTHMWNSMHRSIPGNYFELSGTLGPVYRPIDSYNAIRLASTEAVASGVTTILNYAHNNQSPEHTDAEISAMIDSGIRGRYAYAWYQGLTPDRPIEIEELGRVKEAWDGHDDRIEVGYGSRNDFALVPEWPFAAGEREILEREWHAADELGLPIVLHAGDNRSGLGPELLSRGYVRDGMLLVHGYYFDDEDLAILAGNNTSLSTCPLTGQRMYHVLTPVCRFLDAGVNVCFSFDMMFCSGAYDVFRMMRSAVDSECVRLQEDLPLSHRSALRAGTIGAAEAMGLGSLIGSLTPGKRADVVLLNTRPNLTPIVDVARILVDTASRSEIDTVFVDGRILKRGGQLVDVDIEEICRQAERSLSHVIDAAGYRLAAV